MDERAAADLRPAAAADDHEGAGDLLRLPDPAAFAPDRFPIWIWMDDPCFYGFPTYGEPGPKAAQDVGGEESTPAARTFDRDEAAYRRLTDFLGAHLPGMLGPPIYTKTCLYTLTPDRDFVVDRLPDAPERPRRARGGPRLQVRVGPRPRPRGARSTARRRRPATSSASGSTGRSSSNASPPRASWCDQAAPAAASAPATPSASSRRPIPWATGARLSGRPASSRLGASNVRLGEHVNDRHGYMAGRDEDRAADLNAMWRDPEFEGGRLPPGRLRQPAPDPAPRPRGDRGEPEGVVRLLRHHRALHLAVAAWGDTITFYSNGALGVGAHEVTDFSKESLRRGLFSDEPYGRIGPNPDDPWVTTIHGGRATGA